MQYRMHSAMILEVPGGGNRVSVVGKGAGAIKVDPDSVRIHRLMLIVPGRTVQPEKRESERSFETGFECTRAEKRWHRFVPRFYHALNHLKDLLRDFVAVGFPSGSI